MNKKLGGNSDKLIVFSCKEQLFGLPLSFVERVIWMVYITPLPNAPSIVMGIVNMQGCIIPIFNIRKLFGFEEREPDPTDHLIIVHALKRTVGLAVDEALGTREQAAEGVPEPETIAHGIGDIGGVVKLEDGMILINDLDLFLSIDEERALDEVMETRPETGR